MTRLPPLIYRDVITRLRQAGFVFDRQAKGSHEIWYNPATHRRTTVPNHPGTIPRGTLHAIIREAGLSVDEFCAELSSPSAPSTSPPPPTSRGTTGWSALVERTAAGVDLHKKLASEGAPHVVTVLQRRRRRKPRIGTPKADALVYEFYGLTDEEITVVEEAGRHSRFAGLTEVANQDNSSARRPQHEAYCPTTIIRRRE